MGLKLITPPATEPVSLAEVKEQLGITDTNQDTILTRRISGAREVAESYTGRSLITQTWELALDAFPEREIKIENGPVISIDSVKYYDGNGIEQTLSGGNYALDDYGPQHWVIPAYGVEWPETLYTPNAVKIRYVAGYGSAPNVPNAIKEAIIITVGHWTNFQTNIEGAFSVTRLPYAVFDLLTPYRLPRFGN